MNKFKNIIVLLFLFNLITTSVIVGQITQIDTLQNDNKLPILTCSLQKKIEGKYSYLNADLFNDMYLINQRNQIIKLNSKGDTLGYYAEGARLGNPSNIDVTNPMKVLVYYDKYTLLLVLDKYLTDRNKYNLNEKSLINTKVIASGSDNQFWIFDDNILKKYDNQLNLWSASDNILTTLNKSLNPIALIEDNQTIYLYDKENGFFVFDKYTTFKNNLPFLNWNNISVQNNKLFGFSTDTMFVYNTKSLELKKYNLPSIVKAYKSIKIINNYLYVLKENEIEIYKFEL